MSKKYTMILAVLMLGMLAIPQGAIADQTQSPSTISTTNSTTETPESKPADQAGGVVGQIHEDRVERREERQENRQERRKGIWEALFGKKSSDSSSN